MAGVRDHPAASRSRIDRPGPVSARHALVSGFGTCGRPLRPAQSGHVVLLRLRRFFRVAVGDRLERQPFCSSDLRRRRDGGCSARLQRPSEPRASAPTGSGGTFPQRRGLERQHLSGGNHPRTINRRLSVRALTRAHGGVRHCGSHGPGRRFFHSPDHLADPGPGARTRHLEHCAGGVSLHLEP